MFLEIVTREAHTRKKYSLVSFADNYLPDKGERFKDTSNHIWKVIDHFDGKVVLKCITRASINPGIGRKIHPSGDYLEKMNES